MINSLQIRVVWFWKRHHNGSKGEIDVKGIFICLIIFCAFSFSVVVDSSAAALEKWEITKNEPASFDTDPTCPTYRVSTKVKGYDSPQELCVFRGEPTSFASVFIDGSEPRLVTRGILDTSFSLVEEVCRGGNCIYSPHADVLIWKYTGGVAIYRNAKEGFQDAYHWNENIGSIALSQNGEWLALEVKNVGVDLLSLKTFTKQRVIEPGVLYGFGHDPRMELAVSGDGRYLAVMGEDAGYKVIKVNSKCGNIENPCELVSGNTSDFSPSFRFGSHPVFGTSGKLLSFNVASQGEGTRKVILQHPDHHPELVPYIALGDSFASGEGELSDGFYRIGTNDQFERCHQSIRSYPFLLMSGAQSVACAGAKTSDIIAESNRYLGQTSRLGPGGLNLSDFELKLAQTQALETFRPGRIPQSHFVEYYQPDVVTIGIGGNDAGFMNKLKTCAMPDECEWVSEPRLRFGTGLEIQRLFNSLTEMYGKLKMLSPLTLFYAVGYPQIVDPVRNCGSLTPILLNQNERSFVREGISYINQVIKAAAHAARITYVDMENSLKGYELCSEQEFVNGLRLGDDVTPLKDIPLLKIIGTETFHPRPEGHEYIASSIQETYGDLRVEHTCVNCSHSGPPPVPNYWVGDSVFTLQYDLVRGEVLTANHEAEINVSSGLFAPNSEVRVELHSDHQLFKTALTSDTGAVSIKTKVPDELSEGYHTLHVLGISYGGEPLDIYQVISYRKALMGTSEVFTNFAPGIQSSNRTIEFDALDVLGVSDNKNADVSDHSELPGLILLIATGMIVLGVGILIWKTCRSNSTQGRGG